MHWHSSFKSFFVLALLLTLFSVPVSLAHGLPQEDGKKSDTTPELTDEELALRTTLRDPREAISTFLRAMESRSLDEAAKCLDLSSLEAGTASVKSGVYADKLYFVLTQIWDLQTYRVSVNPDFEPPYQLSTALSPYAEEEYRQDASEIQLVKSRKGMWRFSMTTLKKVEEDLWPKYQARLGDSSLAPTALSIPVWIGNLFPKFLQTKHFLLKDYQWICLIVLTAFGFFVGRIVRWLLDTITRFWFRATDTTVDDDARILLWGPVSLMANALAWYYGAKFIDLPTGFLTVLLVALKFFSVVIAVWTAFRAINLLSSYLSRRAAKTASRYDDSLVPLVSNFLKILAVLVGLVLFVDVFALDWKAVIGGFGVGGIALAIASKEVLGNFFGSVTVLTDRPFEIGDSVVIDGKVEGSVESVGMRSSRLRTFYGSEVIVPNSLLTTAIVDNMGRRERRRFKTTLRIDYRTSVSQVEALCAGIRQLLHNNPYAKSETSYVYLHGLAESSIEILVYAFFKTEQYETELRERHCLLRDILKLTEDLKIGFAHPVRSIHMPDSNQAGIDLPSDSEELDKWARKLADKITQNPSK